MGDWISDQIERLRTDPKERAITEETTRPIAKRDVLLGALWYALLDGDEKMARQAQAYQMYWRAYTGARLRPDRIAANLRAFTGQNAEGASNLYAPKPPKTDTAEEGPDHYLAWVREQIEELRTHPKERVVTEQTTQAIAKRDLMSAALWCALLDGDEKMAMRIQAYRMYWRAYVRARSDPSRITDDWLTHTERNALETGEMYAPGPLWSESLV